ncbi:uncharacterized protein LOC128333178 isoform X4 [Hemicordylus capensis]|uniref:uncharacterized protein LOC128333178 isoform X4 n=1 Tax=Hemicordylus capensis TaxID=884348 RepID=UPI002303EE39|nr:uncharacterized protein LOC128333178 isoform X4 [Hemicordylus capensis]
MKVGVSLAVLLSWLAIANSLRCQKCLSRQGSCTETMMEVCKPQQDACFIEIKWYLGLRADTVKQGCGTTNLCRRYPGGYRGSLYRTMYCCAIDLCRPVEHHVDRNGTKNGLQCHTCIGSIDECGQNTPSESCYGSEERCVQISQRFLPGTTEELEPVIKGCGNDSFKDTLVAYQIGNDFAYVDQKVCTGSNCNNRSFPGLLLSSKGQQSMRLKKRELSPLQLHQCFSDSCDILKISTFIAAWTFVDHTVQFIKGMNCFILFYFFKKPLIFCSSFKKPRMVYTVVYILTTALQGRLG